MAPASKLRILLFDRDENYRSVLAAYLTQHGYNVVKASPTESSPVETDETRSRWKDDPRSEVIISHFDGLRGNDLAFLESRISKGCKATNMALILDRARSNEESRAGELGIHVFHRQAGLTAIWTWLKRLFPASEPDTVPSVE